MTEFEKLQAIIADVLNVSPETITPDTTFVDDLGADSLDIFQIIMGIEEDFDIEIDNEEAEKITTVQDAVDQIQKKKANELSDSDMKMPVWALSFINTKEAI